MIPVDKPWKRLAIAVVERAIEDYIILREIGAVSGTEIRGELWNYPIGQKWRFKPLEYRNLFEVRELIEFLDGEDFDRLCDRLSTSVEVWRAEVIRARIGIRPSTRPLMTSRDLWWSHSHAHTGKNTRRRDGSDLPPPPMYNPSHPATQTNAADDETDFETLAA
jgi:hypothetical protein